MSNRTPIKKAAITGAALKHPARFRNRTEPAARGQLGEPYAGMTESQKAYWIEIREEMPWLNSSHRLLTRLACLLAARMDGDEFGVQVSQALGSVLSKLGATPVDASRVSFEPVEEDPADQFFSRTN